ncbi:MAG: hypothetical protein ACKVWR_04340 [Acidimicrobiales bacterium]
MVGKTMPLQKMGETTNAIVAPAPSSPRDRRRGGRVAARDHRTARRRRGSDVADADPFDRPSFGRFDEQEAPKEQVLIDGDVKIYNSVMRASWWPSIMQQTTIRAVNRLDSNMSWRRAATLTEWPPHAMEIIMLIGSHTTCWQHPVGRCSTTAACVR